jgi:CubicO group peptidase (beta-lactamase class C family)
MVSYLYDLIGCCFNNSVYGVDGISGGGLGAAFPDAFPPLTEDELSPCAYGQSGCSKEVFLKHLATRRQVYLSNTTPAYSNAAFATLGLILESATGVPYADSLRKLLSLPLKLNGTNAATPFDSKRGVIVGDKAAVGWDLILDGAGIGMGAIFSSANDMSAIGRAILSSSLLSSNTTRAWLKPTSHTSSLIGAVGRPWEIFRATLGPAQNNRVVDLYTKSGNVAGYGANLVLIPDYDIGFVVMMAGRRGRVPFEISGVIVDEMLPALEEAARVEADTKFAGTYSSGNRLNSSLKLTTTSGVPGLEIKEWISNSTDMLRTVFGGPENFQMYPTNVWSEDGERSSWRSSYISLDDVGTFSACPSWVALDRPTYGINGLDDFVFHKDQGGKATMIEPKALKIVLERM